CARCRRVGNEWRRDMVPAAATGAGGDITRAARLRVAQPAAQRCRLSLRTQPPAELRSAHPCGRPVTERAEYRPPAARPTEVAAEPVPAQHTHTRPWQERTRRRRTNTRSWGGAHVTRPRGLSAIGVLGLGFLRTTLPTRPAQSPHSDAER